MPPRASHSDPTDLMRLRADAAAHAARLPALLVAAEHLASSLHLGDHGRRRAGGGDEFWQYRHVQAGDSATAIDWRRSGRGDGYYARQTEWQAAQSLLIWSDPAESMRYSSLSDPMAQKRMRADVIALALAELVLRAGERVGWLNSQTPPRAGVTQREGLARDLLAPKSGEVIAQTIPNGAKIVILSDFLRGTDELVMVLRKATEARARGVILHLMDPAEMAFPFAGRVLFQDHHAGPEFETQAADALRHEYQARLDAHRANLMTEAQRHGWPFFTHVTDHPASVALMSIYQALSEARQ